MTSERLLFDPRGPLFDRDAPGAYVAKSAPPKAPIPASRGLSEGRARAARHLGRMDREQPWVLLAESVIERVAGGAQEFTSDDVWAELERIGAKPAADQRRSMGAAFKRLQARGAIRATDRVRLSVRADCHGRGVRVWCRVLDRTMGPS